MEWSDGPIFPDADVYYWLCDEIPSDDYPDGSNWFFLCDPELNELVLAQSTQVDAAARQQSISRINQIFHDQVYWLGSVAGSGYVGGRSTGAELSSFQASLHSTISWNGT